MSDIIANPYLEDHMTKRFICNIYRWRRNNPPEVTNNGLDPFEIWRDLKYQAFHERVVPAILSRLIQNNLESGQIIYDPNTKRVNLSPDGITWTERNCVNYPY